jgi:hypothetical protein
MEKTLKRLIKSGLDADTMRARIESLAKEFSGSDDNLDETDIAIASSMVICQAAFLDRGADGDTFADKWEKAGWEDLNNDERVAVESRRRSFVTVVEFQRPAENGLFEFIDLLSPEDKPRGAIGVNAATTPRYTRLLAWVCHFPNFSQIGPVGVIVPEELSDELIATVRARAKKKAGLFSRGDPKKWLLENYVEAHKLVNELIVKRREALLASLDANHCEAEYRLKIADSAAAEVLRKRNDFRVDDDLKQSATGAEPLRFVWHRTGDSAGATPPEKREGISMDAFHGGAPTIGNVSVAGGSLKLETFARWKFDFAKQKLTSIFGKNIEFVDEKITDLRTLLAEREFDSALADSKTDESDEDFEGDETEPAHGIPATVERKVVGQNLDNHYRKTLDEPIPMLKNKSPRQAAKDPATRPLLVQWAKGLLNSLDRQRIDGNDPGTDLRWLLEELDLKELL